MVFAKLSVWFRDTHGKLCMNTQTNEGYDWVRIWYPDEWQASGEGYIKSVPLPLGVAHVEIEIPPGLYVVQGHLCDHNTIQDLNEATDRVLVAATCGQEICLNLIVPQFISCVITILNPFIYAATKLGIREDLIKTATATLIAAAKIPKEMAILDIEARKLGAKEAKSTEMIKTYDTTLKILKDLKDLPIIK